MKWKLKTSGRFYTENETKKLKKYGFKFTYHDYYPDKPMEKTLSKVKIEINSLDDLEKLSKEFDCDLIVSFRKKTVEIYNDWRE